MEKWNLIIYAPAFNAEKQIPELILRVGKIFDELKEENVFLQLFIVINDGSSDRTSDVLDELRNRFSFLRVLSKEKNEGPFKALSSGMEESLRAIKEKRYPLQRTIVIRMDSDLEHQPEDIPKLIEPIISGKTCASVGYIPFDSRSGFLTKWFNERVGLEESRKFLGADIPQFCPGFNAIRADLFVKLYPRIAENATRFKEKYGCDMVVIDIVSLVSARNLGEKISVMRLNPIEDRWIKKTDIWKLFGYFRLHTKAVMFLKE